MAKAAKRLKATAATGVLQSRDEVIEAISTIGQHVRDRTKIEADMNDELSGIRGQFEGLAAPHAQAIADLSKGVQAWCEAHRAELTQNGKTKTVSLSSGEVKWRLTPSKVSIKGEEAVLALLAARKLERFTRVKTEINKEAILNEPDIATAVPGITISQREEFVIEPFETALAEVAA